MKRAHLQFSTFACPSPHGVRVAWHAAFTAHPAQLGVGQPLAASSQPAALPPFSPVIAKTSVIASAGCFSSTWQSYFSNMIDPSLPHTTKTRSHKKPFQPLCLAAMVVKESSLNPLRPGVSALIDFSVVAKSGVIASAGCFSSTWQSHIYKVTNPSTTKTRSHKNPFQPLCLAALVVNNSMHPQNTALHLISSKIGTCEA